MTDVSKETINTDLLLISYLSGARASKDEYVSGAAKEAADLIAALEAEIDKLEKALGFYADPYSWELDDCLSCDVGDDLGDIASAALNK